jgi:hypothetical protein
MCSVNWWRPAPQFKGACVDTSTCPGPLGQTFHLLTAAVENTKLIELAAAFGGAVAGLVQLP